MPLSLSGPLSLSIKVALPKRNFTLWETGRRPADWHITSKHAVFLNLPRVWGSEPWRLRHSSRSFPLYSVCL
jgi:hypothetical protein